MKQIPWRSEPLATNPRSSSGAPAGSKQRVASHDLPGASAIEFTDHRPEHGGGKDPDNEKSDDGHPQPNPILKPGLPSTDERSEDAHHHQRAHGLGEIPWVHRLQW